MSERERSLRYLAEKWVAELGAEAPARIRQWAVDSATIPADADFFEEIARLAEGILAGR